MATIGTNSELVLLNTNAEDNIPTYNSALEYEDDTLVRLQNDIYRVINLSPTEAMKRVGVTSPMCPLGVTTTEIHNYEIMTWDGESTTSTDKCCFYPEYGWRDFTITADPTKNTDLYDYYTIDVSHYETTVIDCSKGDLVKSFSFDAKVYHSYEYCPRYGYFILGDKLIWRQNLDDKLLEYVRKTDKYLPFDADNNTTAKRDNNLHYDVRNTQKMNSFTISKFIAQSLDIEIFDDNLQSIFTTHIDTDCWLDDNHLLGQDYETLLIPLGQVIEAGYTITLDINNEGGIAELGFFSSTISIDEGITHFEVGTGIQDYNSYTPDAWGNIPEAIKAKTDKFDLTISVPITQYEKAIKRHKYYKGKFVTVDGTDVSLGVGKSTTTTLKRGIITNVGGVTKRVDNDLGDYYEYKLSFLEIT